MTGTTILETERAEKFPDPVVPMETYTLDLLILLGRSKRLILQTTLSAALLATIGSALLPSLYTATANILPPQQSQSLAASMIGQLGSFGAMGALAQKDLGLKNPIHAGTENVVDRVFAETDGRGADAVILAVGGNGLIKTAMDAVRPGGKVMLFAQTQHGDANFDPGAVCMDEKTLMGSYSSSFPILDEVTELVFDGYHNGFDLTPLISHRFPLEEAVAAIDIASHPKADSMKIMIEAVAGGGGVS